MFGSNRKRPSNEPQPDPPIVPAPGVSGRYLTPERVLATYDQLGQTLVTTVTVDSLSGSDAVDLAGELFSRADPESGCGIRHVVFDLQAVQFMDSACVGVLVELLTKLQGLGGRIALVNTGRNVEYLFKLTRLDRLFPMCRDVMKAIEAVERAG